MCSPQYFFCIAEPFGGSSDCALGAVVGSESRKCHADKAASLPRPSTHTHTHGDISDPHSESGCLTNSHALNSSHTCRHTKLPALKLYTFCHLKWLMDYSRKLLNTSLLKWHWEIRRIRRIRRMRHIRHIRHIGPPLVATPSEIITL